MPNQLANPFYFLLLIAGVAFALTACCYGVMIVHLSDPQQLAASSESASGLLPFMDEHGFSLLMWELGVLAVCTFAAIGTDEFWMNKAAARRSQNDDSVNTDGGDDASPVSFEEGASP